MTGKPFRFAVLATPQDHDQWLTTARRAEELGYSGLLMLDGTQLLSPLPALAVAAGATTSLRAAQTRRGPAHAGTDGGGRPKSTSAGRGEGRHDHARYRPAGDSR
jgi:hypothetical protein